MWLFTKGDSDGLLSSATSLGLSFSHDPVPGFCIDPPNSEPLGSIQGPYNLTWKLLPGLKKKSKEEVTIFICNLNSSNGSSENESLLSSLQRTAKWMKTLRHPNMLTWIGGTEIGSGKLPNEFGFVTERVLPLRKYLSLKADCGNFNLLSSWGIHQIAKALIFLNDDGKLAHNAVRLDSVFVTTAGEWKLGALDFVGPINEPPSSSRQTVGFANGNTADPYTPSDGRLVDSWGLGCLIWEIFNPFTTLKDRTQLTETTYLKNIPKALVSDYRRLVAASATKGGVKRSTVAQFLRSARNSEKEGFLANDYVDTLLFLEEIELKDSQEKSTFLKNLATQVTSFPDDVCRHKILPHLVNGLRYGSAGIDALLPVLRLIPLLSEADFQSYVLPCLLKLFSSPERATRVRLLEHLPDFIQHLPTKVIEAQIFAPVSAGFTDTHPIVREATVRAMIHLAPKLSNKLLNENVIKHITVLQVRDEQGGIRTNSTVCLAKLAPYFSTQTQRGPMLSAFLRATRDPFLPNRQAAITALAATQEYYTNDLLAGKLLPCLSFLTTDPEKSIRDDTFRAMRGILDRLEHASENNTISQSSDNQTTADINDPSNSSRLSTTSVAAASALTQWALSALSFSSRLLPASSSSATTTTNTTTTTTGSVTKPLNKQEPSSISNSTSLSSVNKTSKVIEKGDEKSFGRKDNLDIANKFPSSNTTSNKPLSFNKKNLNSSDLLDTDDIDIEDGDDWNVDFDDGDADADDVVGTENAGDNKSTLLKNAQSTNRTSNAEPIPLVASSYWDDNQSSQTTKSKLTSSDWDSDSFFDNLTLQENTSGGGKKAVKKVGNGGKLTKTKHPNNQLTKVSNKPLLANTEVKNSTDIPSSNKPPVQLSKESKKSMSPGVNNSTTETTDDWGDW
ncbi:unnamed protein product [Trichobilharzia szidati]|nr:unnamed protein product [Trichobilharzia szidati]